ncbi:MAG: hypothetical protein FWF25_06825 [Propionibacteriaceae bacterium]|nr:hypothetical protein [Propionibacteriaceae bacterium]
MDANVLAAGITRSLMLLAAPLSNFRVVWSPYAEIEAARHQPPGARPISEVRELHNLQTVPDADSPMTLVDTDVKDRPILGAAAAAGARFVVTENVKDFGTSDLERLHLSAVHPDLFLSTRLSLSVYQAVLDALAINRKRDPFTPAAIHAMEVARKLPRLFAQHRDSLGVDAKTPVARPAKLQVRGSRCVRCDTIMTGWGDRGLGFCPDCEQMA